MTTIFKAALLLALCSSDAFAQDDIVTCQKRDGSRYITKDGDCRHDAQVRKCWQNDQKTVWVKSRKECIDQHGRMYPPQP
jgi:hypothetical protein